MNNMELEVNAVGWFEIPVTDMDRAIKFYYTVFGFNLEKHKFGDFIMAWFPHADKSGAPGSLVHDEKFYKPSQDGVLIYFSSPSGDLKNELDKVEAAGGKVLMPKKQISEDIGYMGMFLDTEGNRIAIHSKK
jgi:predicted enzyme related to lactoylglutathione lyase